MAQPNGFGVILECSAIEPLALIAGVHNGMSMAFGI